MKYAVIEDELFTRERLISTISTLRPNMSLVYEGATVQDAIRFLKTKPEVDLMFMDVELADGECFQIFEEISPTIPIIFTTAFDSYALKAFRTFGIGYVMKPYSDEEIEEAIKKYENLKESSASPMDNLRMLYESLAGSTGNTSRRILTVRGDSFEYINTEEVSAFEMQDGFVHLYRKDGKSRLTNFQNFQSVMDAIPKNQFFQVSRGLILNIECITKVSKYFRGRLMVRYRIGGADREIMVSSTRKQDFLDWLGRS